MAEDIQELSEDEQAVYNQGAKTQVQIDYNTLRIVRDNAYHRIINLRDEKSSQEYLLAMVAYASTEAALQNYTQNTLLLRIARTLEKLEQR
jgi:hypothetical protein